MIKFKIKLKSLSKLFTCFLASSVLLFITAACGVSYSVETNLIDDPSGDIPNYVVSQIVSSLNNSDTLKWIQGQPDLQKFIQYGYDSNNKFHFARVKRMMFFSTYNFSDNPPKCDATITLKLGTPFNCLASGGEFTISLNTSDKDNEYWTLFFNSWVSLKAGSGVFNMDSSKAIYSISNWSNRF